MTPHAALELARRHPDLTFATTRQGDMLDVEEWGAILSPPTENGESAYRYMLWRIFDADKPLLLVMMLNPSTATHLKTDRTIAALMRRSRRLGYGGILVVNCFAYRAKEPADMKRAADPKGPLNDEALTIALGEQGDLLCAWGVHASHLNRDKEVECVIESGNTRPHYLRLCGNGAPEHPLYIPSDLTFSPWSPRCRDASS